MYVSAADLKSDKKILSIMDYNIFIFSLFLISDLDNCCIS